MLSNVLLVCVLLVELLYGVVDVICVLSVMPVIGGVLLWVVRAFRHVGVG